MTKEKIGSIICTLLAIVIFIGVKSCVSANDMSESMKEAKRFLKDQDYKVRVENDADDIEEIMIDVFDIEPDGIEELLLAYHEKAEDMFLILRCTNTVSADNMEFALIDFVILENMDYSGYTVERSYTTICLGHEDLVEDLNK